MKKILALILAFCMILAMCACGSKNVSVKDAASSDTGNSDSAVYQTAYAMLNGDAADLVDAIGEPNSTSYASSCVALGAQDGLWVYDDCYVYTLLYDDGTEIIMDVYAR